MLKLEIAAPDIDLTWVC